MIQAGELKRGAIVELDKAPYVIMDMATQSPSARGAATLVKVKVRNLLTGQVLDKSFKSSDKLDEPDYQKTKGQYLYGDEENMTFMDMESFEQFELGRDNLGDRALLLTDGLEVQLFYYNGIVVNVDLPNTVELTVTECDPVIKGATAQAQMKNAVLETGLEIQVPPYLEPGEKIKVDTRDIRFISRA